MSSPPPDPHEASNVAGLAGLYALNALDGEDRVRFEEYLRSDPEARDEVDGFRAAAAHLAELTAAEPPTGLRDRVLATASETRQDTPVIDLADRADHRRVPRALLAVAAAMVVVIAGLGGYAIADRSADPTSGRGDELAALLALPRTEVVALTRPDTADRLGTAVVDPESDTVVVISDALGDLDPGRVYELWSLTEAGPSPAGLFRPDSAGRVRATVKMSLDGSTGVAITDEPEGGSEQPTTPIIVAGTLD